MFNNGANTGIKLEPRVEPGTAGTRALESERVQALLDTVHGEAERQSMATARVMLHLLWNALRGYRNTSREEAELLADLYLPLTRDAGRFAYLVARSICARRIVEYGTSFGVSTIYLCAAVQDNEGGRVIGSELESGKVKRARKNLERAGFAHLAEIREGDALETLKDPGGPIDLLLLDGWKAQYVPILEMLRPYLHQGSVVLADDAIRFKKSLESYRRHVESPGSGFSSVVVPIGEGFVYSVFNGFA